MSVVDLAAVLRELLRIEGEKDSLEIGPAGSRLKVYGNFSDEAAFAKKINAALGLRALALEKLAEQEASP